MWMQTSCQRSMPRLIHDSLRWHKMEKSAVAVGLVSVATSTLGLFFKHSPKHLMTPAAGPWVRVACVSHFTTKRGANAEPTDVSNRVNVRYQSSPTLSPLLY